MSAAHLSNYGVWPTQRVTGVVPPGASPLIITPPVIGSFGGQINANCQICFMFGVFSCGGAGTLPNANQIQITSSVTNVPLFGPHFVNNAGPLIVPPVHAIPWFVAPAAEGLVLVNGGPAAVGYSITYISAPGFKDPGG